MKRFIATAGILTALLAVNAQAQVVKTANINCTEKGWEFTYTGNDEYFGKFLMNGWIKYVNSQKPGCNITTEVTTSAVTESTTETTTEVATQKPAETTTEIATQKPAETTTVITTQKPAETTTVITTQKPVETTTEKPTETTTVVTTEKPAETTTQAQNNSQSKTMEQQVVDLVNQHRAANGLKPLKINSSVSRVAQAKSEDMRDKKYFDHTSPTYGSPFDMLKSFGVSYRAAGENIAKGQKTAEAVVNAWMNSEGHRKNILNANFEEIGVGYATGNGSTYWTQLFIKQ